MSFMFSLLLLLLHVAEMQSMSELQNHYKQVEKAMESEGERVVQLEKQLHEATSKQTDLVREKEALQGELALVCGCVSEGKRGSECAVSLVMIFVCDTER